MSRVLGVLGGMGALASAAFLTTVYRRNQALAEQDQPLVLLRSNPRIPDRTALLLGGQAAALTQVIAAELQALVDAGADRLVICCMTAHAIWPDLPADLRARGLSLVDALFAAPNLAQRRRLVLGTRATCQLGFLTAHPRFASFADWLVFPDAAGQAQVHALIYALKRGAAPASVLPELAALAARFGTAGLVAGCTEFHLLLDALPAAGGPFHADGGLDLIDPLTGLADRLSELLKDP